MRRLVADHTPRLLTQRQERRFWHLTRAEPATGCRLWTGARSVSGFGRFVLAEDTWYAHRVSYLQWVGPLLNRQRVVQTCQGGKLCVAPDHLRKQLLRRNKRLRREALSD